MVDLNEIDLESLPNVDSRLIPQLRRYFARVMELNGNPLDYRIEMIYNELINGKLNIIVGSIDKDSKDYCAYLQGCFAGMYFDHGLPSDIERKPTIVVSENELNTINQKYPDFEYRVISHEMEHHISYRFNGKERNTLTDYSIIGEPATEIGNLYNLLSGDEEKVIKKLFEHDKDFKVGYMAVVKLLVAINEASGHDLKDIIKANRNNDFEYFCSIIPKEYIEKISPLYDDFFEGKYIAEVGVQSARMLYNAIEQLKEYMYENLDLYPNLEQQTIDRIDSIFEGYEQTIGFKSEVSELLGQRAIYGIDYLDEFEMDWIKTELNSSFFEISGDEIEYSVFEELLKLNNHNAKVNVIMSEYSGYLKFVECIENVRQNVGQEFIVRDNFDRFLDEYDYNYGLPTRKIIPSNQEAVYRDSKTGEIKCFRNGNEVKDCNFTVWLNENDEVYGEGIELSGKVMDEDEWKTVSELILSKGMGGYVESSRMFDKMGYFKEALNSYCFGEKEETSDEVQEFLNEFYNKEYEHTLLDEVEQESEINIEDIEYKITAEDIGRATYKFRDKSNEANEILQEITEDKMKG